MAAAPVQVVDTNLVDTDADEEGGGGVGTHDIGGLPAEIPDLDKSFNKKYGERSRPKHLFSSG